MRIERIIKASEDGCRAVDILRRKAGISGQLSKRIRLFGQLTRNGQPHRMIDPVHTGDHLVALLPDEASAPLIPDPSVGIVWADEWLLVLNKPAGLLTHPKNKHEPDSLLTRISNGRLHPVSRLDRGTSGLVLVGRNSHAHYRLSQTDINKEYLALVRGQLLPLSGTISAPIARAPGSIIERQVNPQGDTAVTHYTTLRYFVKADCSLLSLRLETGRTHQIRVHLQHVGHPIIGETLYNGGSTHPFDKKINHQALHAWRLRFVHPLSKDPLNFSCHPPADFIQLLLDCRNFSPDFNNS